MRKLILITSAAVLMPLSSWGEDITCALTKDCADLGYTETSCPDNNGVKCPWGDAWFCPPEKSEICEIGSILYSDMTCSTEAKAGKTPIGVVVYIDDLGGQALALNYAASYTTRWSNPVNTKAPLLDYYNSVSYASKDFSSCENTEKIMAAGDAYKFPAAWAAHEYSTEGTNTGDWCLPAAGVITSYYNNQDIINAAFKKVGKTGNVGWSSTYTSYPVFGSFNSNYGLDYSYADHYKRVFSVFEFAQMLGGMCKRSQKYTCTGDNETGGIGEACAGKYDKCSCDEGYEWWFGKCVIPCETVGSIFYSDKTCSMSLQTGKTPIGVVIYVDGNGGGQAIALNSIGSYKWGGYGTDIPTLPNYTTAASAATDFASCENSQKIMAAGDKDTYPAVWAAHEYSTEGTNAGDWCLPAAGVLSSFFYNNTQRDVDNGLYLAGGTIIDASRPKQSSTETSSTSMWCIYDSGSYFLSTSSKGYNYYNYEVRPVIEF